MPNYTHATIAGNFVNAPELSYLADGTAIAKASIAVNQGKEKKVSYFDIVAFGRTAEFLAQYFEKGAGTIVGGRLQQRRWDTDEGTRSKVEVVVDTATFA